MKLILNNTDSNTLLKNTQMSQIFFFYLTFRPLITLGPGYAVQLGKRMLLPSASPERTCTYVTEPLSQQGVGLN